MTIKTVAVIGAGTMGNGIAQVFAGENFNVILNDINDDYLARGLSTIESSLGRLEKKNIIDATAKAQCLANITCTKNLQDCSDADIVVEAATENMKIKLSLFQQLDELCKPATILASNTSSISLTKIAKATNRTSQVIGMHFMNPVPVMKLVEIIRARQTSDETFAIVYSLTEQLNKVPVTANDYPGFIANRILMPMINEAIFALQENVGTADDIDTVMKLGMNHPMGPLALADLIGLDTCLSILEVLFDGFKDPKYRPCPLLQQMVDAGHLGRKSGIGFYDYQSS